MIAADRPVAGRHFAEVLAAWRARMTEKLKEWITPPLIIQAVLGLVTITGIFAVAQWRLNEMAVLLQTMRTESAAQVKELTSTLGAIKEGQIDFNARAGERQKAFEDRLRLVEEDGKTQVQINARIQADIARLSAGRF
jgi:hypothetical protein